jgi:prepilin-type N-terminal cleavage/methylation domain-containing protein
MLRTSASRPRRSAFTLIELMTVLVLIGLISATAVLRFGGSSQRAQFEWSLQRLTASDALLRTHGATSGNPGTLEFEIGTGHLERVCGAKREASSGLELGVGVRITRFLAAGRHAEMGKVEVTYDPYGDSETFAIEVEGPNNQSTWILFAGLTGQTRRFEDRRDVERILELVRPAGPDAG